VGSKFDKNRVYLLHWLFEKFSRCGLSNPTDRSVAISGLEQRLGKVLKTEWRYGIFASYFHRCLIWQPCRGQLVKRIASGVPSWSWMAYTGEITFMEIPFEEVSWNLDIEGPFESSENDASGNKAPGARLEAEARELDLNGSDEEWSRLIAGDEERADATRYLRFDEADVTDKLKIESLRYIVVGRDGDWDGLDRDECQFCYYGLVVRPLEGGAEKEYERVGVGSLRKRDLSIQVERVYVL